jgi:hypothetical protein
MDTNYSKILEYFNSNKDAKYELNECTIAGKEQKVCQLNVSLPEIQDFSYGVVLNSVDNISTDLVVVWDVFYTGQFYVNKKVYDEVAYFRGTFPIFYMYNLNDQTTGIFNPESNNSSSESPLAQTIGNKTLVYYRYNDGNYNGWAFSWYSLFDLKPVMEAVQPELPFTIDTDTKTLTDLLNSMTQDVEKSNEKISKMIKKTSFSTQAKTLLKQINEMESNSQNVSVPICSSYTCVSQSASVNIVSKDYSFANTPEGFSYCSHKNATKSFDGAVALCGWPTSHQGACTLYTPKSEVIERRKSLDSFGNLLYDFEITSSTLVNLNNVVVIKNMINNEVVNTITYPVNTIKEEVIKQSCAILDDLISAWNDLPQADTTVSFPEPEAKPEKKSYILSLA